MEHRPDDVRCGTTGEVEGPVDLMYFLGRYTFGIFKLTASASTAEDISTSFILCLIHGTICMQKLI